MIPLNRRTCGGFTLVELVMVMIVGGILAAVAVPRMMDRSAFQSRGGAAEVRTALRYAQRLAMAKNHEVCVTTIASGLTLRFNPAGAGLACSQAVVRPDGGSPSYTVTLPAGITLTSGIAFRFDAQGRPFPNVPVNMTVNGMTPITVARETGYVQ